MCFTPKKSLGFLVSCKKFSSFQGPLFCLSVSCLPSRMVGCVLAWISRSSRCQTPVGDGRHRLVMGSLMKNDPMGVEPNLGRFDPPKMDGLFHASNPIKIPWIWGENPLFFWKHPHDGSWKAPFYFFNVPTVHEWLICMVNSMVNISLSWMGFSIFVQWWWREMPFEKKKNCWELHSWKLMAGTLKASQREKGWNIYPLVN